MIRLSKYVGIVFSIIFGANLTSHAGDHAQSTADMSGSNLRLGIGFGVASFLDSEKNAVGSLFLEGKTLNRFWSIRPVGSIAVSDEEGNYFALGGIKEWYFYNNWSLGVGFSVGNFEEGIEEEDLGHDIEFYSRIMLGYQLKKMGLMRCEFGHISNGGLGDENPGAEIVMLSWVIDL